jgi:tetratricopeptide (TPR) repeat protein
VTKGRPVETRIRLAEGHWELGEHALALDCLEKALADDPAHPGLAGLGTRLEEDVEGGTAPAEHLGRIRDLLGKLEGPGSLSAAELMPEEADPEELPPLPTSTLAELLEEQGLGEKALRVAREVLERNPGDDRAQAVLQRLSPPDGGKDRVLTELERWLVRIRRRRAEGGMEA